MEYLCVGGIIYQKGKVINDAGERGSIAETKGT